MISKTDILATSGALVCVSVFWLSTGIAKIRIEWPYYAVLTLGMWALILKIDTAVFRTPHMIDTAWLSSIHWYKMVILCIIAEQAFLPPKSYSYKDTDGICMAGVCFMWIQLFLLFFDVSLHQISHWRWISSDIFLYIIGALGGILPSLFFDGFSIVPYLIGGKFSMLLYNTWHLSSHSDSRRPSLASKNKPNQDPKVTQDEGKSLTTSNEEVKQDKGEKK